MGRPSGGGGGASPAPVPVVIDTDIGIDPDDALALLLAVASPEVEVRGVTIVDGDVGLRARIAARLLGLAGRGEVPVVPGLALPPGPGRGPTMLGHEGRGLLEDPETRPDARIETVPAPKWLIEEPERSPFQLVVLGPLTNAAAALRLDPTLAERLLSLTAMGGVFDEGAFAAPWRRAFRAVKRPAAWWDHNTASDPEAAMICAHSGLPTTWVKAEQTLNVPLRRASRDELAAVGESLARGLVGLLDVWGDECFWRTLPPFPGEVPLPTATVALLHDPLTVAALFPGAWLGLRRVGLAYAVEDGLFRLRETEWGGVPASVSVSVDPAAFEAFLLERLLALLPGRAAADDASGKAARR